MTCSLPTAFPVKPALPANVRGRGKFSTPSKLTNTGRSRKRRDPPLPLALAAAPSQISSWYRGATPHMPADLPRLIGINHVALEVGDVDEALAFYGKIFSFTLRGHGKGQAFIDLGDQFLALMQTEAPHQDRARHFGLVVDDRARVRALAEAAGAKMVEGPFVDFLDPWGNRVEIVP